MRAEVFGSAGSEAISLRIQAERHRWLVNGLKYDVAEGCEVLDFGFTPVTNTLAIKRLRIREGRRVQTTAVLVKSPRFSVDVLPQTYEGLSSNLVRYESRGGRFVANLGIDEDGMIDLYPGIWESVTRKDVSDSELCALWT